MTDRTGFAKLIGPERPASLLRSLIAKDRLPATLLIHGPPGVGKTVLVDALAETLLCRRLSPDPCGTCEDCRLLAHGTHPDYLVVTRLRKEEDREPTTDDDPDEDGDDGDRTLKSSIEIRQVRDLQRTVALAPRRGSRRVTRIEPADRLTFDAQNALLKTIEEPPGGNLLVLVSAWPYRLLSTVRSRSFSIGLAPLRPDELERSLIERGFEPDAARRRAALGEGCPGRALTLDIEGSVARRESVLSAITGLAQRDPGEIARIPGRAQEIKKWTAEEFLDWLDLVSTLLRDAGRLAAGSSPAVLIHADLAPALRPLTGALGATRAATLVAAVDRLRAEQRINANRPLAAESLLAAIAAAGRR